MKTGNCHLEEEPSPLLTNITPRVTEWRTAIETMGGRRENWSTSDPSRWGLVSDQPWREPIKVQDLAITWWNDQTALVVLRKIHYIPEMCCTLQIQLAKSVFWHYFLLENIKIILK